MIKDFYGLGDFNTNQIKKIIQVIEDEKNDPRPIKNRRPDGASNPTSVIQNMPLDEVPFIIPDAFAFANGPEMAKNFSIAQLEKIGIEGDEYLKETIKMCLLTAQKQESENQSIKELLNYINHSPAWAI
jgi:hypothetical protein